MDAIVGGHHRSGGTREDAAAAAVLEPVGPSTSEHRLAEALLRCMGRWGLSKTTIEDIAREAGMSRATAYRLYPGGKHQILEAAIRSEIRRLVDLVELEVLNSVDVESCLTAVVHRSSVFLEGHEALRFTKEHEPLVLEQYLGFERMEAIFGAAADMLGPALERYFEPSDARTVVVWLARLVLSYVQTPSAGLDLTTPEGARRLVRTFVSPGSPAPRPTESLQFRPHPTEADREMRPHGPTPRS